MSVFPAYATSSYIYFRYLNNDSEPEPQDLKATSHERSHKLSLDQRNTNRNQVTRAKNAADERFYSFLKNTPDMK